MDGLKNIIAVLSGTQDPNPVVQQKIHEALQTFKTIPEFNRYLITILIHVKDQPEFVRVCAGLILKNNLNDPKLPVDREEFTFIKTEVVKGIHDEGLKVRNTCGMIITALIKRDGIANWPGVVQFLCQCLDSPDPKVVHGAFNALEIICEDHCDDLDNEKLGRPVTYLLPKFLSFFNHRDRELRSLAIGCVIKFIHIYPNFMAINSKKFLEGYFFLANDPDISVRRRVVAAFLLLTELQMPSLRPYIVEVVKFILSCMAQDNEDLALEATEFWKLLIHYTETCDEAIRPLLPNIFPVILSKMMYSEQDLVDLGAHKEHKDSHQEDKPQDVKPQFTTSRGDKNQKEDEDQYDTLSNWNIRKSSAEALESLGRTFKEDTLPPLLPLFEKGFQSSDWLARESCILGLGCISIGCASEMKPYLPKLVPYLFDHLVDHHPLIRSITCWTLGRYSSWICSQHDKEANIGRLVRELISRTQDHNKRVQRSAISALAAVIETSNDDVIPYTESILTCFNFAFQTFQRQNMVVLYDAIGTLAEVLGPELAQERYIRLLLPPLLNKWEATSDDSTDLFPILECLSFVAVALGSAFIPYTKPIFDRSLRLIESVLLGTVLYLQNPKDNDLPNRDLLICSIDLLSGLCEALKHRIEPLVMTSKLIPLIIEICQEPTPDVSQSCYALIGDLSKYSMPTLLPSVPKLIPLLLKGINHRFAESTNNAIWGLGEIIMTAPKELILPYSEQIHKAVKHAFDEGIATETCAVTMCRLAINVPALLAHSLRKLLQPICVALGNLPEETEKIDAVKGLCHVVSMNPADTVPQFEAFCDLLAGFYDPSPELMNIFGNLLHAFKNQTQPNEWEKVMESFPNRISKIFKEKYHL